MSSPVSSPKKWPGEDLGLPRTGPRSVARLGRRLAAIAIDWAIASIIAYSIFGEDARLEIPLIFASLQIIFIATLSGSLGHLLLGLRVVPLVPRWIGVWRPAVRSILLVLVVPAVIWDADQRGLHDTVAGTVLVRR